MSWRGTFYRLVMAAAVLAAGAAAAQAPVVRDAWARATPPGMDVGAVYLTLQGGATADRLESATTPRATMTHVHSVEETGGVARMRAVDGLDVPAGKTVVLAPQGLHLMLMGLDRPLVAGERFTLTLHFAKAGDVTVQVLVKPPTAADSPPPAAKP